MPQGGLANVAVSNVGDKVHAILVTIAKKITYEHRGITVVDHKILVGLELQGRYVIIAIFRRYQ